MTNSVTEHWICHAMVAQQPQHQVEILLAAQVPQEIGRAKRPLAEQLAPGRLGPAKVRQRPVQVAGLEVLPEPAVISYPMPSDACVCSIIF
jgi:hypothetical protein